MSRAASPLVARRSARAMDREARDEERRAKRLAATFGLCSVCTVDVGADGIHAWNCTAVPTERRENRGHAPEAR